MSAGEFVRSKYAADSGNIHSIRVQPETLALQIASVANAPPTQDVTAGVVTARARKGIREYGLGARTVTLAFTGALPDGYKGTPVVVPCMTSSFFANAVLGATGTYLGVAVEVIGRRSENLR